MQIVPFLLVPFIKFVLFLQYTYLLDCFEKIAEETKWVDTGE